MTKPKSELLHGTLDMLILQVLAGGPLHGYAIAKRLRAASDRVVSVEQGSLYPALYRMERRGWLRSSWAITEHNRRAKLYRLTAAGRRQLSAETSGWRAFVAAVSSVMRESGS